MTTANRFEDRLLDQLRAVVAARPAPAVARRRPRRGRLAIAGAGVAAATAAVAIVATSGDVTPSAYAVQARPDGRVTVAIRSLRDAAGLERSLRAAGVPAVVDYARPGCDGPGAGVASGTASRGTTAHAEKGGRRDTGPSLSGPGLGPGRGAGVVTTRVTTGDGVKFTLDPGEVKPGEKVYITTSTGAVRTLGMAVAKDKPRPPC